MSARIRSHSPSKSPRVGNRSHNSLDIKLTSKVDYTNISESFADPIIQQIKAHIPVQSKKESQDQSGEKLTDDIRSEVSKHFDDVLLPEEWLELDPVYLHTPPSLETTEFLDILQVTSMIKLFLFLCILCFD
jgi:hypothetical protein